MKNTKSFAEKKLLLSIDKSSSLLDALQKMNTHFIKLLLVFEEKKFIGLISIGDIQRYFINHQTFDKSVEAAMRSNFKVASDSDTLEEIKDTMIKYRTEFMPVINTASRLVDIILWEEVFDSAVSFGESNLNIPVVIMAGGKGTRLRPITNIIPKPLIPVGEKTIVEIIMDRFIRMGTKDFFLSVNYKAEMIKAYFDNIDDKEYEISYCYENKPLGTAGSLNLLKNKLHSTFFVSNCDIIIEQDYSEMYDYHKENNNELTLIVAVKHLKIPYGTIEVQEDGLLNKLKEKPEFTFLVNAGLYLLEPNLIDEIPEDKFFHITDLIEKIKNRGGRVGVFPVNESSWMDIGQWGNYQSTLKRFDSEIIL